MRTLTRGVVLIWFVILAWGLNFASHAQTDIQTLLANARALAATEPAVEKTIPVFSFQAPTSPGTYWTLQLPKYPPLPGSPFPELPVYEIDHTNHVYLYDDRSVDYPGLWAMLEEQANADLSALVGRRKLHMGNSRDLGSGNWPNQLPARLDVSGVLAFYRRDNDHHKIRQISFARHLQCHYSTAAVVL